MGVHATATQRLPRSSFSGSERRRPNVLATAKCALFDDGVAMRYRVPLAGQHTVNGETSAWKVPAGSVVWYQDRNHKTTKTLIRNSLVENVPADANIGAPLVAKLPQAVWAIRFYKRSQSGELQRYVVTSGRAIALLRRSFRHNRVTAGKPRAKSFNALARHDFNARFERSGQFSDMLRNLLPAARARIAPTPNWIQPGRSSWHWIVTGTASI